MEFQARCWLTLPKKNLLGMLLAVISTKRLRGSKACIAGSLHRISKDDFSVVKTEFDLRLASL